MKALLLFSLLASPLTQLFADDACCAPVAPAVSPVSTDAPVARHAGIDVGGCYGKPEPQPAPFEVPATPAPDRHPLKGIVVDVLADKSALLVKHEEIPGVMKAMTMLLKVDSDALKLPSVRKGTEITGLLVRKTDGWWLEGIVAVSAK